MLPAAIQQSTRSARFLPARPSLRVLKVQNLLLMVAALIDDIKYLLRARNNVVAMWPKSFYRK